MQYPNLKAELARNGMTAQELAEKVGVTGTTMSLWMNGERFPRLPEAKAMAKLLNSTMDYLFETAE